MSAFIERQGFRTVCFDKSMWFRHVANGKIMVGSHIDDLCICGTNRDCLNEFRFTLLDPAKGGFEGACGGPLHLYFKTAEKWQKCNLVSGMASVTSDMGWL